MSQETLWKTCLGQIELSLSKANYITWFKNTSLLSIDGSRVTIGVPNGFAKEWLENKYNQLIIKALQSEHPQVTEVCCQIHPSPSIPLGVDGIKAAPQSHRPTLDGFVRKKILEAPSFKGHHYLSSTPRVHETNLNNRYTFDNFIVAENNELARAACYAVSQNLGSMYNPLFIYGGVGLGKTHLLQSIGNEVLAQHQEKRIKYVTSERFTSELISSIQNQQADRFKDYYQQMDLLIIDDVQFLSGKEKTQIEFFHIFNALYQLNKQIVISSDRQPKAIATLEDRLRSRFEGGMIADINRPNLETRIAILEAKARERVITIDPDSIRYIAENITQNIRELEGALNRVSAFCDFHKIPSTLAVTKRVLDSLIESNREAIRPEDIIATVLTYYGVKQDDLLKKGRKKEVAYPRQIAMYLMRSELQIPLSTIGELLGGRDHTTVIHAVEKIQKNKEDNPRLKEELNTLKEQLYYKSCG